MLVLNVYKNMKTALQTAFANKIVTSMPSLISVVLESARWLTVPENSSL